MGWNTLLGVTSPFLLPQRYQIPALRNPTLACDLWKISRPHTKDCRHSQRRGEGGRNWRCGKGRESWAFPIGPDYSKQHISMIERHTIKFAPGRQPEGA